MIFEDRGRKKTNFFSPSAAGLPKDPISSSPDASRYGASISTNNTPVSAATGTGSKPNPLGMSPSRFMPYDGAKQYSLERGNPEGMIFAQDPRRLEQERMKKEYLEYCQYMMSLGKQPKSQQNFQEDLNSLDRRPNTRELKIAKQRMYADELQKQIDEKRLANQAGRQGNQGRESSPNYDHFSGNKRNYDDGMTTANMQLSHSPMQKNMGQGTRSSLPFTSSDILLSQKVQPLLSDSPMRQLINSKKQQQDFEERQRLDRMFERQEERQFHREQESEQQMRAMEIALPNQSIMNYSPNRGDRIGLIANEMLLDSATRLRANNRESQLVSQSQDVREQLELKHQQFMLKREMDRMKDEQDEERLRRERENLRRQIEEESIKRKRMFDSVEEQNNRILDQQRQLQHDQALLQEQQQYLLNKNASPKTSTYKHPVVSHNPFDEVVVGGSRDQFYYQDSTNSQHQQQQLQQQQQQLQQNQINNPIQSHDLSEQQQQQLQQQHDQQQQQQQQYQQDSDMIMMNQQGQEPQENFQELRREMNTKMFEINEDLTKIRNELKQYHTNAQTDRKLLQLDDEDDYEDYSIQKRNNKLKVINDDDDDDDNNHNNNSAQQGSTSANINRQRPSARTSPSQTLRDFNDNQHQKSYDEPHSHNSHNTHHTQHTQPSQQTPSAVHNTHHSTSKQQQAQPQQISLQVPNPTSHTQHTQQSSHSKQQQQQQQPTSHTQHTQHSQSNHPSQATSKNRNSRSSSSNNNVDNNNNNINNTTNNPSQQQQLTNREILQQQHAANKLLQDLTTSIEKKDMRDDARYASIKNSITDISSSKQPNNNNTSILSMTGKQSLLQNSSGSFNYEDHNRASPSVTTASTLKRGKFQHNILNGSDPHNNNPAGVDSYKPTNQYSVAATPNRTRKPQDFRQPSFLDLKDVLSAVDTIPEKSGRRYSVQPHKFNQFSQQPQQQQQQPFGAQHPSGNKDYSNLSSPTIKQLQQPNKFNNGADAIHSTPKGYRQRAPSQQQTDESEASANNFYVQLWKNPPNIEQQITKHPLQSERKQQPHLLVNYQQRQSQQYPVSDQNRNTSNQKKQQQLQLSPARGGGEETEIPKNLDILDAIVSASNQNRTRSSQKRSASVYKSLTQNEQGNPLQQQQQQLEKPHNSEFDEINIDYKSLLENDSPRKSTLFKVAASAVASPANHSIGKQARIGGGVGRNSSLSLHATPLQSRLHNNIHNNSNNISSSNVPGSVADRVIRDLDGLLSDVKAGNAPSS